MPQDQPPRRKPYGHVTDEPNAFRAPHTPIPSLEATTEPPPAPMRKPPPKGYEGPRTRLESHRDESTLVGLAPPAERRPEPANPPPPESVRPRVAERADFDELTDLRIKLAASESGATAQGPKFSLGSAKWWVLVIGALALAPNAVTQVRGWFAPPPVSAPQIDALRASVDELNKTTKATNETLALRDKNDARRWTLAAAALCAQGFRARGLDCDAVQRYADFQQQPLVGPHAVKGTPLWKADATWPALPIPQQE